MFFVTVTDATPQPTGEIEHQQENEKGRDRLAAYDDDQFSMIPTRNEAWELVCEYIESESLRRHMLCVEAAMRAYADRFGENADLWGVVGLLHDFDYERYPDVSSNGHPNRGAEILRQRGVDEIVVRAILAHASAVTGAEPESSMEKALVAVDELTGFLVAVALVRPSRSIVDVEVKSVKKKWKDKAFAAPVKREEIEHGATRLGVTLDQHIQIVLDAMKGRAEQLGFPS
jgi:putative nucleotidyltransferase with HDIG domain